MFCLNPETDTINKEFSRASDFVSLILIKSSHQQTVTYLEIIQKHTAAGTVQASNLFPFNI